MKNIVRALRSALLGDMITSSMQTHDVHLLRLWEDMKRSAINPLNRKGEKFFSQCDEDGITLEILNRIGLRDGVFVELGVGSGSENNTLILLASGWRGVWLGGEELFFDHRANPSRLCYLQRWITRNNVVQGVREGLDAIKASSPDVLSLDLDGNDLYLLEDMLRAGITPSLFIVEYNAKFPPPIRWKIRYDEQHQWRHDDYFGASLASFNDTFNTHGYTLVCCSLSGANGFFVRNELLEHFRDVPRDIGELFAAPKYFLFQAFGHKPSPKTIEQCLLSP